MLLKIKYSPFLFQQEYHKVYEEWKRISVIYPITSKTQFNCDSRKQGTAHVQFDRWLSKTDWRAVVVLVVILLRLTNCGKHQKVVLLFAVSELLLLHSNLERCKY